MDVQFYQAEFRHIGVCASVRGVFCHSRTLLAVIADWYPGQKGHEAEVSTHQRPGGRRTRMVVV